MVVDNDAVSRRFGIRRIGSPRSCGDSKTERYRARWASLVHRRISLIVLPSVKTLIREITRSWQACHFLAAGKLRQLTFSRAEGQKELTRTRQIGALLARKSLQKLRRVERGCACQQRL